MSEALAARAGISYRQLDHWTRVGYLRPRQPLNHYFTGTGYRRLWPEGELEVAAAMGRLVKLGMRPEAAHAIARSDYQRAVTTMLERAALAQGIALAVVAGEGAACRERPDGLARSG